MKTYSVEVSLTVQAESAEDAAFRAEIAADRARDDAKADAEIGLPLMTLEEIDARIAAGEDMSKPDWPGLINYHMGDVREIR
jgi:hypothetical protein